MAYSRSILYIMDYYDLVLGTIPVSIFGGTGVLGILGIDLWTAVSLGALLALGIILHAIFVRAPGQNQPMTSTQPSSGTPPRSGSVE